MNLPRKPQFYTIQTNGDKTLEYCITKTDFDEWYNKIFKDVQEVTGWKDLESWSSPGTTVSKPEHKALVVCIERINPLNPVKILEDINYEYNHNGEISSEVLDQLQEFLSEKNSI